MTQAACDSKLRLVVRSSMDSCRGNWVAIERAVVYHARVAHAYISGIKCQHCRRGILIDCCSALLSENRAIRINEILVLKGTLHLIR